MTVIDKDDVLWLGGIALYLLGAASGHFILAAAGVAILVVGPFVESGEEE